MAGVLSQKSDGSISSQSDVATLCEACLICGSQSRGYTSNCVAIGWDFLSFRLLQMKRFAVRSSVVPPEMVRGSPNDRGHPLHLPPQRRGTSPMATRFIRRQPLFNATEGELLICSRQPAPS